MFNPLVDRFDELTDVQVEEKILELTKKYWQASKNPSLQSQILAVLEMFKQENVSRQAKARQKSLENSNSDLDNLINIS